jgi:hypothetical protein
MTFRAIRPPFFAFSNQLEWYAEEQSARQPKQKVSPHIHDRTGIEEDQGKP